jgi:glycosyltransferase involved in cell wall biosynthesis
VRVLFVDHTSTISGGGWSLLDLLASLPPGVDPILACPDGPLAERAEALSVPVKSMPEVVGSFRLGVVNSSRAVLALGSVSRRTARLARATEADLVHANSVRAGLAAVAAKRSGGRPTVVHVRDVLPPGVAPAAVKSTIKRGADAVIAISQYVASALGRDGRGVTRVIHNGVDLDRFDPGLARREARRQLALAGDGPFVLLTGQITPWKGQRDTIEVIARLRSKWPTIQLLIAGAAKFVDPAARYDNAAYERELRAQVAAGDLARNVVFLGERDDVPQLLRAADLALVPSWEEPFGRTVVEALAAGTPVVATSVGGTREIIERPTEGMLVPPRRPDFWAEAISELLDNPRRREEMARLGRARAEAEFGQDRCAARMYELYEELVRKDRHREANRARAGSR